MGYKSEDIDGVGTLETFWEERYSLSHLTPNFDVGSYSDTALTIARIPLGLPRGDGSGLADEVMKARLPETLPAFYFPLIRSRVLQNIVVVSDDKTKDTYGGYLTNRHFPLAFDVIPYGENSVTVIMNRGRFNYEKKEDGSLFPISYGSSDVDTIGGLTQYQSSFLSLPFYSDRMITDKSDIGNYTYEKYRSFLRFGSSSGTTNILGNPAIDTDIASLTPSAEDELLLIIKKMSHETEIPIGSSISLPVINDFENFDVFLSLNSLDSSYKSNDNYVVFVLGKFKYEDGIVYDKEGPFNIGVSNIATIYGETAP